MQSVLRGAAGLVLFRLGLAVLGTVCRDAAASHRGRVAALAGRGGVRPAAIGLLAAALVQSSGVVTAASVQAAGAGLVDLRTAICLVLGANVGTTVTAHLVALDVHRLAPLLIVCGSIAFMGAAGSRSASARRARLASAVASAAGLMLFGLGEVSEGAAGVLASTPLLHVLSQRGLTPASGAAVGLVVSALTTSSTLAIGVVVSLCQAGVMSLRGAVPVILGANVGTCATAWLASAGAGTAGRRVAAAHLLFNLASAAVCLVFLEPFVSVVQATGGSPGGMAAWAHTLFNLLGVAIALPAVDWLARVLETIVN